MQAGGQRFDPAQLHQSLKRLSEFCPRADAIFDRYAADGARHEAYVHRVGADFLEARDPAGSELLVPYAGLVAVQSRED